MRDLPLSADPTPLNFQDFHHNLLVNATVLGEVDFGLSSRRENLALMDLVTFHTQDSRYVQDTMLREIHEGIASPGL
jgi:hypothetical protein